MELLATNLDFVWYVISFILVLTGIAGSFLPVIPGPLVSWIGLLTLQIATPITKNYYILGITLILTIALSIADYVVPYLSSKKYGGSKYGGLGASLGLVVGIFVPFPFAILICAFLGAFLGEMIYQPDFNIALRAAIGSFIGIMATNVLKFIVCTTYMIIMIYQLVSH